MLTAGAIVSIIMFIATFIDFCRTPTWKFALPMLVSLAMFATFFGARVAVHGASC